MQAHKEGKKRSLVIRKCEVDESARITARTNVDETGTVFMVKCKYRMEEEIFSLSGWCRKSISLRRKLDILARSEF